MSALIVEQDELTRGILQSAVEARGWTVVEAFSADGAWNLLRDLHQPLVVILNYDLPANDAWRVL